MERMARKMERYGTHMERYGTHMERYGTHMERYGTHMERYGTHAEAGRQCTNTNYQNEYNDINQENTIHARWSGMALIVERDGTHAKMG
ncbi:MAG: hypothetical protein HQL74_09850 [Magnetococcales bacterium]|nr:hypothetical protein [Magnetococcales bacterium]